METSALSAAVVHIQSDNRTAGILRDNVIVVTYIKIVNNEKCTCGLGANELGSGSSCLF